jgi:hypothetical protein
VNTNDIDQRIRAALSAAADEITDSDLRPEHAPTADPRRPWRQARWLAPVLAAAAVIAVVVGTAAVISSSQSSSHQAPPANTGTPVPTPSASLSVNPTPTVTTNIPSVPLDGMLCYFADFTCPGPHFWFYEPLWPFQSWDEAKAWQAASATTGAQPWHLDPGETALLFTQNYLGYRDITKVTSTKVNGDEAHIGVGYDDPNGQTHTAAVLHLVHFSRTIGDDVAPWEVVGSDDTDFSLEQPKYGAQVSSPMTVGGHITGVDENIVVVVRNQSGEIVSGSVPSVPAGGDTTAWHTTAPFTGTGVLTIVAFTGGHLLEHERFAIQGVHT